MKVHEIIASAVGTELVGRAFVVLGHGNMATCVQLRRYGTELVSARHEAAAVSMAEGHSLATGNVGFAAVTQGPGLTQIGTSLMMASRNRIPMVVLTGDTTRVSPSHVQAMDQRRFIEACESVYRSVRSSGTVFEDVREAFYRARVECRPVVLAVDAELQEVEYEWGGVYRSSASLVTSQAPGADGALLDELTRLLMESDKPLIVVGRGAVAADAGNDIRQLAERVGAVILTSLPAKGWLSEDPYVLGVAGLFASSTGDAASGEADLVLGVGASLNRYTLEGGVQFPNAEIWSINMEGWARFGDVPVDRYIVADARRAVRELEERLAAKGHQATGFRTREFAASLEEARGRASGREPAPPDGRLDPRSVVQLVDRLLPADSYVVVGQGHFWGFPISYMRGPGGSRFIVAGESGAVGQGLSTALGFAMGAPGATVVLFEGDGSLFMHLQELDTAARYGIRLLTVVMNDEGFGSELHSLRAKGLEEVESIIRTPDLARVAEALGVVGHSASTGEDVEEGVRAFLADHRPHLVDARVSREVLSESMRRFAYGEDVHAPLL